MTKKNKKNSNPYFPFLVIIGISSVVIVFVSIAAEIVNPNYHTNPSLFLFSGGIVGSIIALVRR